MLSPTHDSLSLSLSLSLFITLSLYHSLSIHLFPSQSLAAAALHGEELCHHPHSRIPSRQKRVCHWKRGSKRAGGGRKREGSENGGGSERGRRGERTSAVHPVVLHFEYPSDALQVFAKVFKTYLFSQGVLFVYRKFKLMV